MTSNCRFDFDWNQCSTFHFIFYFRHQIDRYCHGYVHGVVLQYMLGTEEGLHLFAFCRFVTMRSSGWLQCSLIGVEPGASPCAAASSVPAQSLRLLPTPFVSFWIVMAAQTARLESTRWSWRFTVLGDSANWALRSCPLQEWHRIQTVMSWMVQFVTGECILEMSIIVIFILIRYIARAERNRTTHPHNINKTPLHTHTHTHTLNEKHMFWQSFCEKCKKLQKCTFCLWFLYR